MDKSCKDTIATIRTSDDAWAVMKEAKITVTMHKLHATHRAKDLFFTAGKIYPMGSKTIPKETRYRRVRSTRCYEEMPTGIRL